MTKIQVLSDLHDEFNSYSSLGDLISSDADVVILAGDIVTPSTKHRLKDLKSNIYYVTGNHELYGISWDYGVSGYQNYFKDSNIHVLENDTVIIPGTNIRIIGASLFTDFWAPGPSGKEYHGGNCMRGMSDFTMIKGLTVDKWESRHRKSLNFIKKELAKKFDGKTIVMTHHSPSFRSNPEEYKNSTISGGFCSDLEYLIEEFQPEIWAHGHCHNSSNYEIGKTRAICNPRGYPHELNPDFNKNLIIGL